MPPVISRSGITKARGQRWLTRLHPQADVGIVGDPAKVAGELMELLRDTCGVMRESNVPHVK